MRSVFDARFRTADSPDQTQHGQTGFFLCRSRHRFQLGPPTLSTCLRSNTCVHTYFSVFAFVVWREVGQRFVRSYLFFRSFLGLRVYVSRRPTQFTSFSRQCLLVCFGLLGSFFITCLTLSGVLTTQCYWSAQDCLEGPNLGKKKVFPPNFPL